MDLPADCVPPLLGLPRSGLAARCYLFERYLFVTLPLTSEEYSARWKDTEFWTPIVREILATSGFPTSTIERAPTGSNIVYHIDGAYIKLFPPFDFGEYESEVGGLPIMMALPVESPRLLGYGPYRDDWNYVIVSALDGVLVRGARKEFTADDKLRFMQDLGRLVRAVRNLPIVNFPHRYKWEDLIDRQAAGAFDRHMQTKLPEHLLNQLPEFLGKHIDSIRTAPEIVMLTGEYTPDNMLARKTDDSWRLTGMFDYGDVMNGHPEYDLLGPTMFYYPGNAELQSAFFRAYYREDFRLGREQQFRLMTLALLHRFSNLKLQLTIHEWEEAKDFEEVAQIIWPC